MVMAKNKKQDSWVLDVQEDENGDAVIEFPPDLLARAGWQEGDTVKWRDLGDGSWSLSKKDTEEDLDDDGWDAIFGNPHRDEKGPALRVPITRETISKLNRLMEATDLDQVEMVVSHASGIGPSVSFSYRGVIDATDYGNW
jgi:hypothetical protein